MKRFSLDLWNVVCKHRFLVMGALAPGLILLLVTSPANADIRHRYSFNEGAAADASNRTINDSVGGAHGTVKGAGATAIAGELVLPGGPSATAAYVDLPNGIASKLTDATFEGWYTMQSVQAWSRIFDFGSSVGPGGPGTAGSEQTGPGGGGEGQDYIFYTPSRNVNIDTQRTALRNFDPGFGPGGVAGTPSGTEGGIVDPEFDETLGMQRHFAVTYDNTGAGGTVTLYIDGVLPTDTGGGNSANPATTTIELRNLNDVNNWLGRSNWSGDANFGGSFNEFRIYDTALTASQVRTSFANGPNGPIVPEPASILVFGAAGAGCLFAAIRRKRR